MKNIPIILMGCGGVGRPTPPHIVSCRTLHANKGIHLRVVGIFDSKSFLVVPDVSSMEFNDTFLMNICQIKSTAVPSNMC
ncbi:unnamed protein product [Lactuca virosa]|uniref:Uncharacterized protein n=1 Tax=Lactuca virosa TaxID=75947 RepID=A0AAU9PSM3_9ASTR|nr:unnamed protein product [Lactuca virosa]